MRKPAKSKTYPAAKRGGGRADAERRELALLEEFIRCDSVISLAGAIAARLGRKGPSEVLIEAAGLAPGESLAVEATALTGQQLMGPNDGGVSMVPRR